MAMQRTILLPVLLMGWACASDVDLEIDLSGRVPGASGDPASPGSIDELSWSFTELGAGTYNYVPAIAWAPDGTLVASGMADDRAASSPETTARLVRFSVGGEPLWTVELDADELDSGLPIPEGHLSWKSATIDAIDVAEDGTIVIAVNAAVDYSGQASGPIQSSRSLVQWYEPDGDLIATASLGGITEFPINDSTGEIYGLSSIRALPDGTALWTGMSTRGEHPLGPFDLVAEGAIGRVAADGEQLWTVVLGNELDVQAIAPEEEIALDLQLTPDGGVVLRGMFNGELVIGDKSARIDDRGTFVARMELDGQVTWLSAFDESEPVGYESQGPGMGLAASGDVLALVTFFSDYLPPEVPGSSRPCPGDACIARIDRGGELSSLNALELPRLRFGGAENLPPDPGRMTLAGNMMIVTGTAGQEFDGHVVAWPAFVALNDLEGNLLAARGLGAASPPPDSQSKVWVIAPGPDGQIAVAGNFYGSSDFGAGEVIVEPPMKAKGFVAVYAAPSAPPDVD